MKKCIICKTLFKGNSNSAKTCSIKCRKINNQTMGKKWDMNNPHKRKKYNDKYFLSHHSEIIKRRRLNKNKYYLLTNKWRKNNPDRVKMMKAKDRTKHKEEYIARNRSLYYISIPKGQLCQECKIKKAVHRHHPDYSKPLKVKFLCRTCHGKEHRKYKINVRKTRPNSIKSEQGLKLIATCWL